MSDLDKLQALSKRTEELAQEIRYNTQMLKSLDTARVRVNLDSEYFSGLFDFGEDITEYIRERVRERLTERLERAKQQAKELV